MNAVFWRTHKRLSAILVYVFVFYTAVFTSLAQQPPSSEEGPIYFNAATEKYIQGDIDAAVVNVQKAIALEPDNKKYLDFASKMLYEGALEAHNTRNYKRAYDMLEKALKYSPSDEKIQNLYKITQEIMTKKTPSSVSTSDKETPSAPDKKENIKPALPRAETSKNTIISAHRGTLKDSGVNYLIEEITYLKKWIFYLVILCIFIFLAAASGVAGIFSMIKKIKLQQKFIKEKESVISEIEKQKSSLLVEIEKLREALRYERENSNRLARELKEEKNIKNEHFKEQLRLGLDIRQKQLEELIKSMKTMRVGTVVGSGHSPISSSVTDDTTHLSSPDIYTGRARILESIGDATYIDENSSTALESIRERIVSQAKELNELSSVAAINFLKEMVTNSNPFIRANILKALSHLPSEWSVDMLISVARTDPVIKVRREAIREIKYLKNAMDSGEIVLEESIRKKVKDFIENTIAEGEWIF